MTKDSVGDWDTTALNNSEIAGINISENCAAANINNAIREMMAQLATNEGGKQPADANLTSLAGLTLAADKGLYSTAADTLALFDLTAAGRALLDDADASAQRTTLGLGTAALVDVIDEDDLATDSATRPPSQQSVKAYVDGPQQGTWRQISRDVVSSSQATVDIAMPTSGYDLLELIMINVAPVSSGTTLELRFSNDGGSSFHSGASDYDFDQVGLGSSSADNIRIGDDFSSNSAQSGSIKVVISSNHQSARCTSLFYDGNYRFATGGVNEARAGGGKLVATEVNDAVRLLFSSGNIARGTFILQGLAS